MFCNLNFKILKAIVPVLLLSPILISLCSGCSSRNKSPLLSEDSTLVYMPESAADILAAITLSNKISKGKPVDDGTIFPIKDNAKLYAVINLKNRKLNTNKDLMFHIEWIDSKGNSFYKKRIDLPKDDSSSALQSSISITPQKRQTGNYTVRVYYFRELIAEKKFLLTEATHDFAVPDFLEIADKIKSEIVFYKGTSKKTGKPFGKGKTFPIKNKAKVLAIVNITNIDATFSEQLKFTADWIDPDDSSFYRKNFKATPGDSSLTITSSISISPDKRKPGNYRLKILLADKLISEQKFELTKEVKEKKKVISKVKKGSVTADIILCRKVDKKTGKPVGIDSVFTIKDKANLKAIIHFENRDTSKAKHLNIYLNWVESDKKTFYKKRFDISTTNSVFSISNSISISAEKRKPGNYILRVFLSKELIAEKKFQLIPQIKNNNMPE